MTIKQRVRNYYWLAIQGNTRGVGASLFRGFLSLLSMVYFVCIKGREVLYRIGLLRSVRLSCKVISVGNITTGGTGKTPLVAWIAKWLAHANPKPDPNVPGLQVAILARGYGKTMSRDGDDEALIEAEGVRRFTAGNRAALAKRILRDRPYDAILLDDGFQHFRIRRDLNIVTVDATQPFSNGYLLPRGLLRERPQALQRADLIVITHADQVSPEQLESLRDRLAALVHHRTFVETFHKPVHVVNLISKRIHHLNWLKNRKVFAFCGIGNPDTFRATLELVGADVVKFRAFPDHHVYTHQDIKQIEAEAGEFMADTLMTTEKDALRMDPFIFDVEVMALKIELEIIRGEQVLEQVLSRLFHLKPASINTGQASASSTQD